MRLRSRQVVILILVMAAAVILFFMIRGRTKAGVGPAVALCPGPDAYGYVCQSGAGYAYIDATKDTGLYEDDGVLAVDLPFPFTFYGTSYTQIQVSSNGNIQFRSANPDFFNRCMVPTPVAEMGDMIAPFWDDLDLRSYGFLELETVGSVPERVFVVEWDGVPRYGSESDDRVTFEVQLFEKNNDIVFLYQHVATLDGYNGSSATIGLQSEAQASALQYGCQQPVVADASGIRFPHPSNPPNSFGLYVGTRQGSGGITEEGFPTPDSLPTKGGALELIRALDENRPRQELARLRDQWLRQFPRKFADWRWVDLNGDQNEDLVLIWRGDPTSPELDQLVVLEARDAGPLRLRLDRLLSARQPIRSDVNFQDMADFTGDGIQDVLLWDDALGEATVISDWTNSGQVEHRFTAECRGKLLVSEVDGDGMLDITFDNCDSGSRMIASWNGNDFVLSRSPKQD